MLTLRSKQCKSDTGVYYFIDEKTRELVITIVYNNICFIGSKDFPLLLELKQKFITKLECYDLEETKEFLRMYINYNCKDQKILIDQSEYLNKVLT